MNIDKKISYVEFPSSNLELTKKFFSSVFNWSFADYGPKYIAFTDEGLNGGFYKSELNFSVEKGAPLIVIYSQDLEAIKADILNAGGIITKDIFTFPGGKRFHFVDTVNNEYAVWSEA